MPRHPPKSPEVFVSYSSKDKRYKDDLLKQLKVLAEQKVISAWHDGLLVPGQQWNDEIVKHLKSSRIILLLISPDFLASDYVNKVELKTAADRHQRNEACVIPVLVRNINSWQGYPFGDLKLGDLQAVPPGAKFIVDWENRDKAFAEVASGIQRAVEQQKIPAGTEQNPRIRSPMVGLVAREGRDSSAHSGNPMTLTVPRTPEAGFFVPRRNRQGCDILELIQRELTGEQDHLVALWGAGGTGKTTLAVQAVRKMTFERGFRVIWIGADKRNDFSFSTFIEEFARQLNVENASRLSVESKITKLKSLVDRSSTLVVLDNFETISPDEGQKCLDCLKNEITCRALFTTRERLKPAVNIPVDEMSIAEALEFLERLVEKSGEPTAINFNRERVIKAAGANPEVMQWVIAQLSRAQRPDDVLDELSHGAGEAVERVFSRSFNLPQLGDDGRTALLALAFFVPSATREALAAIAGFASDIKRTNQAIASIASLRLLATPLDERLALHALTRDLAKAQLTEEDRADFQRRFIEHFLKLAEDHSNLLPDRHDALDAEEDNSLNALRLASEGQDWSAVLRFYSTLKGFLNLRGHWREALTTALQAKNAARELHDESLAQILAVEAGIISMHTGDRKKGEQFFNDALAFYQRTGDGANLARVLHNIGIVAYDGGKLKEAQRRFDDSLAIKCRIGDKNGMANTLYQKAMIEEDRQDFFAAYQFYSQSLKLKEGLNDRASLAIILHSLAVIARQQRDYSKVRELYKKSLKINKELGDSLAVAITIHMLGLNEEDYGSVEKAAERYRESLEISREHQFLLGMALTLHALAGIASIQGDAEEAKKLSDESVTAANELRARRRVTTALSDAPADARELGEYYRGSELGNRRGVIAMIHSLRLLANEPDYQKEAARLLREALYIFEHAN